MSSLPEGEFSAPPYIRAVPHGVNGWNPPFVPTGCGVKNPGKKGFFIRHQGLKKRLPPSWGSNPPGREISFLLGEIRPLTPNFKVKSFWGCPNPTKSWEGPKEKIDFRHPLIEEKAPEVASRRVKVNG